MTINVEVDLILNTVSILACCSIFFLIGVCQYYDGFYWLAAPRILRLHDPRENFDWNIQYEVVGFPPPNITWLKDGRQIISNEFVFNRAVAGFGATWKGSLTFKIVSHNDNGNYTIIAQNAWGTDQRTLSAVFMQTPGNWHMNCCLNNVWTLHGSFVQVSYAIILKN
jgi:hypothetical protein